MLEEQRRCDNCKHGMLLDGVLTCFSPKSNYQYYAVANYNNCCRFSPRHICRTCRNSYMNYDKKQLVCVATTSDSYNKATDWDDMCDKWDG